jgi:hypothetical protein
MGTFLLLAVVAFAAGVGCTLAVLFMIERRVLARPGTRMAVAIRMLDEAAQDGVQ